MPLIKEEPAHLFSRGIQDLDGKWLVRPPKNVNTQYGVCPYCLPHSRFNLVYDKASKLIYCSKCKYAVKIMGMN